MGIFISFHQTKEFLKLDHKQLRYIGVATVATPRTWQALPDVAPIRVKPFLMVQIKFLLIMKEPSVICTSSMFFLQSSWEISVKAICL